LREQAHSVLPLLAELTEERAVVELHDKVSSGGGMLASVFVELLQEYVTSEKPFASTGRREEDILADARDANKEDLSAVMELALSHSNLTEKNKLISAVLTYIQENMDLAHTAAVKAQLHEMSLFGHTQYADIGLKARLVLAELDRPKFSARKATILKDLEEMRQDADRDDAKSPALDRLLAIPESILDVLSSIVIPLDSKTPLSLRKVATETLLYRAYRAYEVKDMMLGETDHFLRASWSFRYLQASPELKPIAALLGAKPHFSIASYDSADNLSLADNIVDEIIPYRMGEMAIFDSWEEMEVGFSGVIATYAQKVAEAVGVPEANVNVLYVLVRWQDDDKASEGHISARLTDFCISRDMYKRLLQQCGVKSITFIVAPKNAEDSYPGFYTFRTAEDFAEDLIYRNVDPPMAFQLELSRLSRFDIERVSHPNRALHVFYARAKGKAPKATRDDDVRFFVRVVVRQADVFTSPSEVVQTIPEAERAFAEALDAVEIGRCNRAYGRTDFNHVFLNILPVLNIEPEDVDSICRRIFQRYAAKCWLLRVFSVEIRAVLPTSEGLTKTLRFLLFNPSGHMLKVEGYYEEQDAVSGTVRLVSMDRGELGHLHGSPVQEPYPTMDRLQRRRVVAQTLETTYVYDFQHLFAKQLQEKWRRYSQARLLGGFKRNKIPVKVIEVTELILDEKDDSQVVESQRSAGQNTIGMVAWRFVLNTPECPSGRTIIVIANDITFRSGSFGPKEDALFRAVSALARKEGLPRIYLAANSGARIGLAEDVRASFEVQWKDPRDPTKGFNGLSLPTDAEASLRSIVDMQDDVLTSVVGNEEDLGVENLVGSGLIAGETSAAYEETFTLTFVTSRSVGIGAYLVRLGQRVIQKENGSPIILTGFSALNKVLGHQVYISNEQLGGIKVMHPNGVSHRIVRDDLQGVEEILTWLSYVPRSRGDGLPIVESMDPIKRSNLFVPPSSAYDPRSLIAGSLSKKTTSPVFGLFDADSWTESLAGWARTVICGRARLGGIPVGVITSEIRQVERHSPADPALPETHESVINQAGQVWFPDSADKTAQAIRDIGREELPLFILANWRGFSGGMRDMFDEILKTGSRIVDALREYRQPVFVYIPPGGELRGGAWVVVDTKINPDCIEMYADSSSRGGVLEPEGTVDVKYRRRDLLKTMHRLDDTLRVMDAELGAAEGPESAGSPLLSEDRKRHLQESIAAREADLMPVYRQIATAFADLHDTPTRMLRKNAIRGVVDWEEARSFFYWRLQRRIAEFRILNQMLTTEPSLGREEAVNLLRKWFEQDANTSSDMEEIDFAKDDRAVFQWLEEKEDDAISSRIARMRQDAVARRVRELHATDADGLLNGIEAIMHAMDQRTASEFASTLQTRLSAASSKKQMSAMHSSLASSILTRLSMRRTAPEEKSSQADTSEPPAQN